MRSRTTYTNAVLTAIAAFLGLLAIDRFVDRAAPLESVAMAQPEDEPGGGALVSAAEQRKQIIAELRNLGKRLDKLEARLTFAPRHPHAGDRPLRL